MGGPDQLAKIFIEDQVPDTSYLPIGGLNHLA